MEEIEGGRGRAIRLRKGQAVRLVNTFGQQTVDAWALGLGDTSEYMSVEHTRRMLSRLFPTRGDTLFSNRRNPMLLIEEDTFPGQHDMLIACCDRWLYKHYGCEPGHRNCHDNFLEALFATGLDSTRVPNPLNLWMNVPVESNNAITLKAPVSAPGDHVTLRALMDVVVVFSTCPMDITPVNGDDLTPKAVQYEVI